ncbi:MAG: multidrug efflux MFS transporter, partial [Corynebacterium marinum]|nr:multidrug efflux MFS transporter [Corynebacterium marinum]
MVMILNETILSVALPSIMADFRVPAATAQWLTTGFMLTMAVVIPTTGFLLQRFTTRLIFLTA